MSYFNPEPPYKHGDPPKIGIILANLGTPDAADAPSLRKYLGQFLMDRRVVEIPRFIWCWILHFIILVFRPNASAKKYAQVWTSKGSPLLVNARSQEKLLKTVMKKNILSRLKLRLVCLTAIPRCNQHLMNYEKRIVQKSCYFHSTRNMQRLLQDLLWTLYGKF